MASVLHRTDMPSEMGVSPPIQLKNPANRRGSTRHFQVFVDPALGANGRQVADTVLARCEGDYGSISGYFGGLSAGPFSVILYSNPGGAYHMGCSATDIFCDVRVSPVDGDFSEFLNVAEFVEVFEAVQAKGWGCGASNGEGLSRVLAGDLYRAELDGFATARAWLDSSRPNFVDRTDNSDTNPVANGCAVLFLNWLRFQLSYSWQQIVAAAGPDLGATYAALARKSDGYRQFAALMNARFPPGKPSGVATDNPFPL